jgi:tripartite-type tricarboxylate transporter receptor subunit TctC
MDPRRRRFLHLLAGAAALSAAPGGAWGQSWPTRPVRVIVPFQPGGSTDIFARLVAQKLTERFGKQFYIENIAGATGNVGTAQAARAAPDGHTFLIAFSSYVVNPTLFAKLPFDPDKDLVPVTLAVLAANVVSVASAVAGHTPIAWSTLASAMQALEAGQLRALAVTSKTRSQLFPDIPTTAEAGYPQIEGDSWVGLLAPAGTPNEIIGALQREITAIIALPDVKERLPALGFEAVGSTPEEFAARIKVETEIWGKVIRAANIKPE